MIKSRTEAMDGVIHIWTIVIIIDLIICISYFVWPPKKLNYGYKWFR